MHRLVVMNKNLVNFYLKNNEHIRKVLKSLTLSKYSGIQLNSLRHLSQLSGETNKLLLKLYIKWFAFIF
jgi:hypothetical protein